MSWDLNHQPFRCLPLTAFFLTSDISDTAERVKAAAALVPFASENKPPGAAAAEPVVKDVQGCAQRLYFHVKHYPALFCSCYVSSFLLKTHAHSHTPGFTESVIISLPGEYTVTQVVLFRNEEVFDALLRLAYLHVLSHS